MKNIILILLLLFVPFFQNEPDTPVNPLDSYKAICISAREAILNQDADSLRVCKNRLAELNNSVDFGEFPHAFFTPVHPETEESLDGHILYKEVYFLELLKTDFGRRGRVRSDLHVASRGENDIIITHHVIPAGSEGVYRSIGSGKMRFVVITERPCPITVSVSCPDSGISCGGDGPDFSGIADFSWSLGDDPEPVFLTIQNHSETSVCFLLASGE